MKMVRNQTSIEMGKEKSGIAGLPDNIYQYFNENTCAIQISICHTDALNDYGSRITKTFDVFKPYCKCNRCGYHSLWNPDDTESKCRRHTYERGWDSIFTYCNDGKKKKISLEDAFEEFLEKQPDDSYLPVKKGVFL